MYRTLVKNLKLADCCASCFYSKENNSEEQLVMCTFGVKQQGYTITDIMEDAEICDAFVRFTEGGERGKENSKILKSFIQKDKKYGEVCVQESSDKLVIIFKMICKEAPDMFLYKRGNFPEITKDFNEWFTELVTKHIPDKVLGWSHQ
jgi:hypothetical protein